MIQELQDKRIVLALAFFAFVIGWLGVLSPFLFWDAERQEMIKEYTELSVPLHLIAFAISIVISSTCAFVPKTGPWQNVAIMSFLLMLASAISLCISFWVYDYALEPSGYNQYMGYNLPF